MTALAYQRSTQRFEVEAFVMLEDFQTNFHYNGTIYNYSADGVYLESDYAPRPGRKMRIRFNGARDIFDAGLYLAEIRWRQALADDTSDYAYGLGMQYC